MSALRKSADLQSIKTRHIVVQNADGSFPDAYALLAAYAKGRGVTELTQDISVNSVTLVRDVSSCMLAYSDVSGLLVNSSPISSLPPRQPFDLVPAGVLLPDLVQSYNELLAILNGILISVKPPPPVLSLTASPSVNSVNISWNSVGAGYEYTIYLDGVRQNPDTSSVTYSVTGLTPNTTYTISIRSHYNPVFFSIPTTIITKTLLGYVSGFFVSEFNINSAVAYWNSFGSGFVYDISGLPSIISDLSGSSYSLTSLAPTSTYTISIIARNGALTTAPTFFTFTTADPALFVIGHIFIDQITASSASLRWSNPAGYSNVYLNGVLTVSDNVSSCTLNDLSANTAYIVDVCNKEGPSISVASTVRFLTATVSLPYVTNIVVFNRTSVSASARWDSAGTNYNIYLTLYDTGRSIETVINSSGTSVSFSSLSPNTNYGITIRSTYDGVQVGPSNPTTFFTLRTPPMVTIIVGAVTSSSISLSWNPIDANLFSYNLYYHTGSNADTVIYDISGSSPVSYTLTNLSASTTYRIDVRSTDGVILGSSNPISVTTASNIIRKSFDIYNDPRTTKPPRDPNVFYRKNTHVLVSDTSSDMWSSLSDLSGVNQIDYIELDFYSGLSIKNNDIYEPYPDKYAEAQLLFSRDNQFPQFIFEAGFNRVFQQSSDRTAVGSSVGGGVEENIVVNRNIPITIAYIGNEILFKRLFGNGTDTIDKLRGIQFKWIYQTGNVEPIYINNCQLNAFKIYYNVSP